LVGAKIGAGEVFGGAHILGRIKRLIRVDDLDAGDPLATPAEPVSILARGLPRARTLTR